MQSKEQFWPKKVQKYEIEQKSFDSRILYHLNFLNRQKVTKMRITTYFMHFLKIMNTTLYRPICKISSYSVIVCKLEVDETYH